MDYYKTEVFAIIFGIVLVFCLFCVLFIFVLERRNNTTFYDFFSLRWWLRKDADTCPVYYKTYSGSYSTWDKCCTLHSRVNCTTCNVILDGRVPHRVNPFAFLFFIAFVGFIFLIIFFIFKAIHGATSKHCGKVGQVSNTFVISEPPPAPKCGPASIESNQFSINFDEISKLLS